MSVFLERCLFNNIPIRKSRTTRFTHFKENEASVLKKNIVELGQVSCVISTITVYKKNAEIQHEFCISK